MRKILLILLVALALGIIAVYIFIPGKLTISSATTYHANRESVNRFMINAGNWEKWWPGTVSKIGRDSFLFRYKNLDFRIEEFLYDAIRLALDEKNNSSGTLLKVVPFTNDSMGIAISTDFVTGWNPFIRVAAYSRARKVKQALDEIVQSLKNYTSDVKNIYGINITNEKVQYQHLISAKQSFSHYPTTDDIYNIVGRLRNYIQRSGAKELFFPMLNISRADSSNFVAQVGLPVDRDLPAKGDITSKWMMKGGNILSGEVTGGQKQIEEGKKEMELYIRDYQRSIIAIPFQMLITDRTKEPDSTRWLTRLYYPVV